MQQVQGMQDFKGCKGHRVRVARVSTRETGARVARGSRDERGAKYTRYSRGARGARVSINSRGKMVARGKRFLGGARALLVVALALFTSDRKHGSFFVFLN